MSVYVFHGDKGGVGKSLIATAFTEYLLSRELPVALADADQRNGDVGRLFSGVVPTIRPNLRERDGWLELADFLDQQQATDVVLVLPANIGAEFTDEGDFFREALRGLNRALAIFFVLDRSSDSVVLLRDLVATYKDTATLVAVRNLYFGDSDRFVRWNESKVRAGFLNDGGKEMDFEELLDSVIDETFLAHPPRRFTDTDLVYLKKLTLRRWLDRNFATFDGLSDYLGVGKR
ncbi:MAG: hypothetical protein HKL92_10185 [Candidatus Eremiobacteraeota bacterium]|nr:hypothetical protein [Candidatus Eremiobacteraeota bacterium]